VFKPSTDSASLVVPIQKQNFSVLGLEFSWGGVTCGGVSRLYGLFYAPLDAHRMGPRFGPNIFTKLGYPTSL